MILVDYSQVAIGNLHQQIKKDEESLVQPALLKSMVLNSIRKNNRHFKPQFGQMVICADDRNCWRKNYFSQYKARRHNDREESGIDWNMVFQTLDGLRDELREYFPYKVMHVPMAEADDIIGVLAKSFSASEKVLILSGDKDFKQLQVYPNVQQYAPVPDQYVVTDNPVAFLKEHIIRGDERDDVPNFFMKDDYFITRQPKDRQKSIIQKKLDLWVTQQPEEFCENEEILQNYRRNEKMVDLNQIPAEIQTAILEEWAKPIVGDRSKIYGYLVKNRMKNLMELIRDF